MVAIVENGTAEASRFQALTRGAYLSERRALRAARKAEQDGRVGVTVLHTPASAFYGEYWAVGFLAVS